MKMNISLGIAALAVGLTVSAPTFASTLSKIGKATAYPVKKAVGNGSKNVNHGGKAAAYPVRKAGVNTSKATHKVVK